MKKILQMGCLLVVITCMNAYSMSSGPFYFAGVTIPAKGSEHLNVPPGMHETGMTITCDAVNPNYNKPYPIVIRINRTSQIRLNHETTRIRISHQHIENVGTSPFYPLIENLDDTDTVNITNCSSNYITS